MMDLLREFLIDDALIVIPVLLILGVIFKNTPKIKDWLIPYVLLILGVAFAIALIGYNVDAVLQGVLVAGAAVFSNQLYKQYIERSDD